MSNVKRQLSMMNLLPGTEVIVRGLHWEVIDAQLLDRQTLYRLRCLEGQLLGEEFDFLWPLEKIEPLHRELNPAKATPLANWLVYHQGFILEQALGPNAIQVSEPGRLELEPYQLVPMTRSLQMSRVRLLLADGVGLGKTIQAGLIAIELMARRMARRMLVVCPAGPLLEQWRLEMLERFGVRLEVIDRAKLEEVRRARELGANPFDYIPLGLVSMDFLKQERILALLERASYDLVVLDEAHHCMELGGAGDREDSQRRRLALLLARRSDAFLMLTATPHNGSDRSFASLCELIDPALVDGGGNLRGNSYRYYVIRRLKRHILDKTTKEPKFQERIVKPLAVSAASQKYAPFRELQQKLLELLAPQLKRAFKTKRYSDVLAFIALLKRSVSTVEACRLTLTVVAERFQQILTQGSEDQENRRQRLKTLRDYQRKIERFGTISFEEEEERTELEIEDIAQQLADLQWEIRSNSPQINKVANLVESLDELLELAENAVKIDPKIDRLIAVIKEIRKEEPGANVLVYTEYIDSQRAVAKALQKAKAGNYLVISGNDSDAVKNEVIERFSREDNLILISTDTAAEGLNLQQRCHHLIHLELPFNPNRLEQRNGRIDRFGQKKKPQIYYFYLRNTFEESILLRLIAKYEKQRSLLTFVPNTLGVTADSDALNQSLLKNILEGGEGKKDEDYLPLFKTINNDQIEEFNEVDENLGVDEETKAFLREIDKSLQSFEATGTANPWLTQVGLNSGEELLTKAAALREEGMKINAVNLRNFVQSAVLLYGGNIVEESNSEIFNVQLPPGWNDGLDELPGYDKHNRNLRLTSNLKITRDANDKSVGFLGRSHPLVKTALERVRNLSFGKENGQDIRVSAVLANVAKPTLLLTYLGRVSSQKQREWERVIAVKISADEGEKIEFYDRPQLWLKYGDTRRAIKTTDVWKNYFQSWWKTALQRGGKMAAQEFKVMANTFVRELQNNLGKEEGLLGEWLRQRSEEILPLDAAPGLQLEIGGELPKLEDLPQWMSLEEPLARLEAFVADKKEKPTLRREADAILQFYRQRREVLDARGLIKEPEVIILGMLMLVNN